MTYELSAEQLDHALPAIVQARRDAKETRLQLRSLLCYQGVALFGAGVGYYVSLNLSVALGYYLGANIFYGIAILPSLRKLSKVNMLAMLEKLLNVGKRQKICLCNNQVWIIREGVKEVYNWKMIDKAIVVEGVFILYAEGRVKVVATKNSIVRGDFLTFTSAFCDNLRLRDKSYE